MDSVKGASYYVGQCSRGIENPPLFVTMAIDLVPTDSGRKPGVYFRRKHLAGISPYFEFYAHKWIPSSEVFHILEHLDSQTWYHDHLVLIVKAALSEASERHAFKVKRKELVVDVEFTPGEIEGHH
jgi:hypothetical protein